MPTSGKYVNVLLLFLVITEIIEITVNVGKVSKLMSIVLRDYVTPLMC